MTPTQRKLARHALGLPNFRNVSYRNRFIAANVPDGDVDHWFEMSDAGLAEFHPPRDDDTRVWFWLTRKGAEMALVPGERLDPEDFPEASE